jgi:hypothetical protein
MQPPAAGSARRPVTVVLRRMNVDRHDTIGGRERMRERSIVREPQIAPEPDYGRDHVLDGGVARSVGIYGILSTIHVGGEH